MWTADGKMVNGMYMNKLLNRQDHISDMALHFYTFVPMMKDHLQYKTNLYGVELHHILFCVHLSFFNRT